MPNTIAQHTEQRQQAIERLLHNGTEVTLKDLGWLIYGMNADMSIMAATLARICSGTPVPKWRLVLADELVKWGARAVLGLGVWLVIRAIQTGWTP